MSEKPFPTKYCFNGRVCKPHPAADCFPLLSGTPFRDLVDDIRANGIALPIPLLGDFVLDGRSRLLAAEELGLTRIPVKQLPDDTDAVAFVASLNIHRRHLTATQRTNAAARLLALSHAAFRANYPDEPDPDDLESPLGDDPSGLAAGGGEPVRQSQSSLERRASSSRRAAVPASSNGDGDASSSEVSASGSPVDSAADSGAGGEAGVPSVVDSGPGGEAGVGPRRASGPDRG